MVALGAIALVGWALERRRLTELGFGSSSLKANTALCFIALGVAVMLRGTERQRLRTVLEAAAGVIAVATIVESRQETRMQSESPKKTAMTFLRGRRFVWSVRETVSECGSATVVASSWTMIDTSGVTDRGVDTAVPG